MTGFTHELQAPLSNEWYTPLHIFTALGITFDLDPCAPPTGSHVPAKQHISLPEDGLAADWHGNVWLNPPYGKQTPIWLERLTQHGNGIALVFARTDTRWFQQQLRHATGICFIAGRIKFIDGSTNTPHPSANAGSGSALIAYGNHNLQALHRSNLGQTITINT